MLTRKSHTSHNAQPQDPTDTTAQTPNRYTEPEPSTHLSPFTTIWCSRRASMHARASPGTTRYCRPTVGSRKDRQWWHMRLTTALTSTSLLHILNRFASSLRKSRTSFTVHSMRSMADKASTATWHKVYKTRTTTAEATRGSDLCERTGKSTRTQLPVPTPLSPPGRQRQTAGLPCSRSAQTAPAARPRPRPHCSPCGVDTSTSQQR